MGQLCLISGYTVSLFLSAAEPEKKREHTTVYPMKIGHVKNKMPRIFKMCSNRLYGVETVKGTKTHTENQIAL